MSDGKALLTERIARMLYAQDRARNVVPVATSWDDVHASYGPDAESLLSLLSPPAEVRKPNDE